MQQLTACRQHTLLPRRNRKKPPSFLLLVLLVIFITDNVRSAFFFSSFRSLQSQYRHSGLWAEEQRGGLNSCFSCSSCRCLCWFRFPFQPERKLEKLLWQFVLRGFVLQVVVYNPTVFISKAVISPDRPAASSSRRTKKKFKLSYSRRCATQPCRTHKRKSLLSQS